MSSEEQDGWMEFVLDEDSNDILQLVIDHSAANEAEFSDEDAEILFNADGSVRKVKRVDYSRGAKKAKLANPWENCMWLTLLRDESTEDPSSRNGKEFHCQCFVKLFKCAKIQMNLNSIMLNLTPSGVSLLS
jgi:hypothetical protein